jgi:hypothetical protein
MARALQPEIQRDDGGYIAAETVHTQPRPLFQGADQIALQFGMAEIQIDDVAPLGTRVTGRPAGSQ